MPMQDLAALLHSKKLASECKRSVDAYFSACNMLCSRSPLYKKTFSIMSRMRGGSILNCRCPESADKTIENVSKHQKPGKIAHVYFTIFYICLLLWLRVWVSLFVNTNGAGPLFRSPGRLLSIAARVPERSSLQGQRRSEPVACCTRQCHGMAQKAALHGVDQQILSTLVHHC